MNLRKEKGITLISLVVTIIILIILAGISISLLIGENGIISRAKSGTEKYKIAQAKEKLELVLDDLLAEKVTNPQFDENDDINNELQENNMQVEGNIVIVDGYLFEIDRSVPKIINEIGQPSAFWKQTQGKASFVYNKKGYVKSVEVSINIDESAQIYTVQYNTVESSKESSYWTEYTPNETFTVTKNGTIYGRIVNLETNEIGYTFIGRISNIDDIAPQKAKIEFNKTSASVEETIQATVTQVDNETEISIENCKYIINTTEEEIGVDSDSWNSATKFTQTPQTINITQSTNGTYYLHILSVDIMENKTETVSEKIKFNGGIYLSTSHFGWPGNMNGWKIVGSSSDISLENNANKDTYVVTNEKIDISEINLLRFNFNMNSSNSGVSGNIILGLTNEQDSTEYITKNEISYSWNKYPSCLELNLDGIEGEYYIKIQINQTKVNGRAWISSKASLIGE